MRYLIVLLAIAGIVVSSLALKVHYDTGSEPCRINDKWDCGVVLGVALGCASITAFASFGLV